MWWLQVVYSALVAVLAGIGFRLIIRPAPPIAACVGVAVVAAGIVWLE